MKKITILFLGFLLLLTVSGSNAFSFSIAKSRSSELLKYEKGSEFIKLSFKQFAKLTGKKDNVWNKLSFGIMKARIKYDLKTNPDLILSDYNKPKHKISPGLKALLWIVAGFIILYLLVLVIYEFGT